MSHLLDQLLKSIEAVKAHPLLLIEKEIIEPPAVPDMIDRLELMANTLMPQDVKEFYQAANGLTCTYRLRPDLDERTLEQVRANGEQLDLDHAGTLGRIHLQPIQNAMLNIYWKPPSTPADAETMIDFAGKATSMADLGKRTKLMDIYEPENDAEAMAFLTQPYSGVWEVLLLDDYLADWRNSLITDFSTYILVMAATRFTIPSRKRIFGKFRGDLEPMLRWDTMNKKDLVPALFL